MGATDFLPSRVLALLTIIIEVYWKGFRTEFLFPFEVKVVDRELKVVLVGPPILYIVLRGSYSSST